jgi:Lrp/AsnC family transcriptional regulator, leucine-responsive regulatory protein
MDGLDNLDLKILTLLQENAQLTSKELSGHLNLSLSPIYERIRRLEKEGYIKQYVTLLDKDKLGFSLVAFCHVSLKEHAKPFLERFEQDVLLFQEVVECYHVTGNFDYMLKVLIKDMKEYQNFIVNKLAMLANIGNAQSQFVMTEIKSTTFLPI